MVAKYVLALFLGACLSTATHGAEFGLVQLDGAGHAILILGSKVPPGSKISFQFERREGGPGCCKELLSRDLVEIDSTELLVSNEVTDDAVWAYRAHSQAVGCFAVHRCGIHWQVEARARSR